MAFPGAGIDLFVRTKEAVPRSTSYLILLLVAEGP
jgi:hypothetical protein